MQGFEGVLSSPYKRVLLKLSGEAFVSNGFQTDASLLEKGFGIDPVVLNQLANEVSEVAESGIQIGIVIGGGNFFRGRSLISTGVDPITSDQMGILSTLINALAFKDAIIKLGKPCSLLSAISVGNFAQVYNRDLAISLLEKGNIVLLAGGTGNPLVTTDSAASLRGVEIKADIVLKATHVDGIYSKDPKKDPSAIRYQTLTFDEAISKELAIMDLTAFYQCRTYQLPIQVFNIKKPGALLKVVLGENEGTLVKN